jgi:hypothetical protein
MEGKNVTTLALMGQAHRPTKSQQPKKANNMPKTQKTGTHRINKHFSN